MQTLIPLAEKIAARLEQRGDIGKRRALEILDDDPAHANTSGVSGKMR